MKNYTKKFDKIESSIADEEGRFGIGSVKGITFTDDKMVTPSQRKMANRMIRDILGEDSLREIMKQNRGKNTGNV